MASREDSYANLKEIYETLEEVADRGAAPKAANLNLKDNETPNPLTSCPDADTHPPWLSMQKSMTDVKAALVAFLGPMMELMGAWNGRQGLDRETYTTAQFAEKVVAEGHRKHLTAATVRKWCREQRLKYKEVGGRGEHGKYRISHAEYLRFVNDGPLPAKR